MINMNKTKKTIQEIHEVLFQYFHWISLQLRAQHFCQRQCRTKAQTKWLEYHVFVLLTNKSGWNIFMRKKKYTLAQTQNASRMNENSYLAINLNVPNLHLKSCLLFPYENQAFKIRCEVVKVH